jgi:DNA-binding NarL/FixJ family response regulator
MPDIRLLLVDDHEVVRTGLRMLLESHTDLKIVGEASNGAEALELCELLHPDVVVMDLILPDTSGIEITRRIKQSLPQVNVVALTIHEDQEYFFETLRAGASGYVPKRAAPEELVNAIRVANTGEVYIFPSLVKVLVRDYLGRSNEQADVFISEELTQREQEVLDLLVQGLTNEAIANQLIISKHTVARHRENIMRKLNLHNRSELVKYAIRKGLIEP